MIINFQDSYLFVHIPKCAGESMKELLISADNKGVNFLGKHDYLMAALDVMGSKIKDFTTFTVVRNPFSQVVSFYEHLRKPLYVPKEKLQKQYPGLKEVLLPHKTAKLAMKLDFQSWVKQIYVIRKPYHKLHGDQLNWLTDKHNILRVDRVLKFEDLNEDLPKLQKELGIKGKLPHKNESKKLNYQAYYDEETKEIIEGEFEPTLKLFDYQFEGNNQSLKKSLSQGEIAADYLELSRLLKANGNEEKAIDAAKKSLAINRDNSEAYKLIYELKKN